MIFKKNIIISSFFESFKAIKEKKFFILFPVIIDLLFIISFGFTVNYFLANIEEKAVALIQSGKSMLYAGSLIKGLFSNNDSLSILLSTLGIMITAYINYCIFQGSNWMLAKKFVHVKVSFFAYMKKFFLINLFWFFLFYIVQITDYFRRLFGYLRQQDYSWLSNALIFLLILIVYFAFISYTLLTKYNVKKAIRKSFSLGIKKIHYILFMYLILYLIFLLLDFLAKINFVLMILVGILLVSPAFTWARIFINLVVGKLDKK
ncbi:MAG: hypothetical protein V1859_03090 [archaeon]